MAAKMKETVAFRLSAKEREHAERLAKKENRKLGQMLRILVAEALRMREGAIA